MGDIMSGRSVGISVGTALSSELEWNADRNARYFLFGRVDETTGVSLAGYS